MLRFVEVLILLQIKKNKNMSFAMIICTLMCLKKTVIGVVIMHQITS